MTGIGAGCLTGGGGLLFVAYSIEAFSPMEEYERWADVRLDSVAAWQRGSVVAWQCGGMVVCWYTPGCGMAGWRGGAGWLDGLAVSAWWVGCIRRGARWAGWGLSGVHTTRANQGATGHHASFCAHMICPIPYHVGDAISCPDLCLRPFCTSFGPLSPRLGTRGSSTQGFTRRSCGGNGRVHAVAHPRASPCPSACALACVPPRVSFHVPLARSHPFTKPALHTSPPFSVKVPCARATELPAKLMAMRFLPLRPLTLRFLLPAIPDLETAELGVDYHPEVLLWFRQIATEMGGDDLGAAVAAAVPSDLMDLVTAEQRAAWEAATAGGVLGMGSMCARPKSS